MPSPAKKLILIAAAFTLSFVFSSAHAQESTAPKLAQQQYKNIKTLKGLPADANCPECGEPNPCVDSCADFRRYGSAISEGA